MVRVLFDSSWNFGPYLLLGKIRDENLNLGARTVCRASGEFCHKKTFLKFQQ